MRTYKVGICDRDIDYSKALMEYVNSDMSLGFQIVIFSTLSHLRDYLETRSLDLIVTDDISECEKKGTDIYLSDVKVLEMSEMDTRNSGEGYSISDCYIYRYQMVSDICRQIKKQLVPNNVGMRSVSRFICVYSPIGRCGKTRLAKKLAGLDEVRGGLYVGMEDFSDRLEYLTNNMLYPLKMNRSDLEDVINMQIRQEQGIYMSVLSGTYMDTFDVSCSEIVKLKNLFLKTGNFTTICFDIECLESFESFVGDLGNLLISVVVPLLFTVFPFFRIRIPMPGTHPRWPFPGFRGAVSIIKPLPGCVGLSAEVAKPVLQLVSGLPAEILPAALAAQSCLPGLFHLPALTPSSPNFPLIIRASLVFAVKNSTCQTPSGLVPLFPHSFCELALEHCPLLLCPLFFRPHLYSIHSDHIKSSSRLPSNIYCSPL